ncbi:hypothetical protein HNR74_002934 [Flammeovirga kamogawensis]|nr:hypothetical protein [Flammeovirga kamogawensis]
MIINFGLFFLTTNSKDVLTYKLFMDEIDFLETLASFPFKDPYL